MLDILLESNNIIMEGISKFVSPGKELGADQSLPAFSYMIFIAQPKKLQSCIKYFFILGINLNKVL